MIIYNCITGSPMDKQIKVTGLTGCLPPNSFQRGSTWKCSDCGSICFFLPLQGDINDPWTNLVFKAMPVPFVWCADNETENKRLSAETYRLSSYYAEGCLLVLGTLGKDEQQSGAWRKFHSLSLVSSNIGPLTPQRSLMWNNLNYFMFCLHLTDMKSIPFSPNWETFAGLDLSGHIDQAIVKRAVLVITKQTHTLLSFPMKPIRSVLLRYT